MLITYIYGFNLEFFILFIIIKFYHLLSCRLGKLEYLTFCTMQNLRMAREGGRYSWVQMNAFYVYINKPSLSPL